MGGGSRRHQINEGEDTLEGKLGVDGRWRWIYPVLVLILIGLASAGWSDKNIDRLEGVFDRQAEYTEFGGFQFTSSQSVSGIGIASSYRSLGPYPSLIHSHSSGSGYYGYESTILVRKDVEYKTTTDEYISSSRVMKLEEDSNAAYSPTDMDFSGSFKTAPIRTLWTDSTIAGNQGGAAINARFDHLRAISRKISTEVSGGADYHDVIKELIFSGSFVATPIYGSTALKMKLDVNFNGTAQIGMDATGTPQIGMDAKRDAFGDSGMLLDEYYRGSFSLAKTMGISTISQLTQSEDELWLPCCNAGYSDMRTQDWVGHSAEGVFNCTCFKLKPASGTLA